MKDWNYEPARDHGLKPGERLKSLKREGGLGAALARGTWRLFTRTYLALYHRLRIEGREHLPAAPPCVLVANHTSHLDAITLAAALPRGLRRSAFPIAAGDTFFETPAATLFAAMAMNALPMWRRRAGRHAMEELRDRLVREPAVYILFPEGTRSRDGKPLPFKPGIGMLVAGADVPVVPCRLAGAHEALPPDRRLPRPRTITLTIKPPLRFQDHENARAGWTRVATELERAVFG